MTAPKFSGKASTNTKPQSVAKVHHSEPAVFIVGRVAAWPLGYLGWFGPGGKPSLHLTLLIYDAYSGIVGFDGQPTDEVVWSAKNSREVFRSAGYIRTNIYMNTRPNRIVRKLDMLPPKGMSKSLFAQKIAQNACAFASYVLDYSLPSKVVGSTMVRGQYNSGSYVAGLLNSVMGYVPEIHISGYQIPGWDTPIPASYFKGEALR